MIAFFSLILALTNTFIPLYDPIVFGFGALTVNGICMGVYGSSFQIWFKQMFHARLNTLLNINQLCYGLGTAVSPLIAASYLYGSNDVDSETRKASVLIPYIITGAFQTFGKWCVILTVFFVICISFSLASSILFVLFVTNRYYEPPEEKEKSAESKISTQADECNNNNLNSEAVIVASSSLSPTSLECNAQAVKKPLVPWRKTKLSMCTLVLAFYYTSENGYLPYCSTVSTLWVDLFFN